MHVRHLNAVASTVSEKISEAGQMAHAFHLWACLVRIFLREKWEFTVKKEYVSVQDMNKAVEVLVNLVQVWEQQSLIVALSTIPFNKYNSGAQQF